MKNQPITSSPSLISWGILILLSMVWGSSYILIKKSLIAFSPIQVACLRLGISAIAFFPVFLWHFSTTDWSKLKYLVIVGVTGSGLPALLFSTAQTEISSSVAGVLSSLSPLFTLVIGIIFFGTAVVWSKVTGILVGLLGAVALIVFGQNVGIEGNLWYGGLVVIGCLCYAISSNTVKAYLQDVSSIKISSAAFFIVGFPCLLYLLTSDVPTIVQTHEHGWQSLGTVTLLAMAGTVMATILFFKLVQVTNPVFASLVSYLIPIVAIFLGAYDGEPITFLHLTGMALILTGVYLTKEK
ncbi:MAG: EamA family transporter [Bacteroidota bacterium]